jgi:sulfur carrier protein ThiS
MTHPRNIALLSFSGNAGKTTLARNLFARHMPDAALVSIESINADGQEAITLRGKQFSELLDALALTENGIIVDVGASNVEDFLQRMTQTRRSHQLFDLFVVPVMPGSKQTRDCIATIEALAQIGVPAANVIVVCNGLDATDTVQSTFGPLVAYISDTGRARLATTHISDSEVFSRLAATGQTLSQVLDAELVQVDTDVRVSKYPERRLAEVRALALQGMAETAAEELDAVWAAIA